jgi:hypothetical protein
MSGIPRAHLLVVGGIGLAIAVYIASVLKGTTPVLQRPLAGTQHGMQHGKHECRHSHHSTHTQESPVRCPAQPDVRNIGGEWILSSAADKQQAYERLAGAIRIVPPPQGIADPSAPRRSTTCR